MTANREALLPRLQKDSSIKPPFFFGQIQESALRAEVVYIFHHARGPARTLFELGQETKDDCEENWIIRWLLWHVFRYRDIRNIPSQTRNIETTPTALQASHRNSPVESNRNCSDVNTPCHQSQEPQRRLDSLVVPPEAVTGQQSTSSTRFWDPVRGRYRD